MMQVNQFDPRPPTLSFCGQTGLQWLLNYARLEYDFFGIDQYDPTETKEDGNQANVAEVEGLRLEWDFTGSAWTANFVSSSEASARRTLRTAAINTIAWSVLKAKGFVTGFRAHSTA